MAHTRHLHDDHNSELLHFNVDEDDDDGLRTNMNVQSQNMLIDFDQITQSTDCFDPLAQLRSPRLPPPASGKMVARIDHILHNYQQTYHQR
jgi:hypothetical protein